MVIPPSCRWVAMVTVLCAVLGLPPGSLAYRAILGHKCTPSSRSPFLLPSAGWTTADICGVGDRCGRLCAATPSCSAFYVYWRTGSSKMCIECDSSGDRFNACSSKTTWARGAAKCPLSLPNGYCPANHLF